MKNERATHLRRIVSGFRSGVLNRRRSKDRCWMVSAPLQALLVVLGHDCELTEGQIRERPHFWITLRDGRIIDATADQFRDPDGEKMPTIYIGAKPSWYVVP